MKTTIFSYTFGSQTDKQVSVEVNRFKKGHWPVCPKKNYTYEYEVCFDLGNGMQPEYMMRSTLRDIKKFAEKKMIERWVHLNPLN